MGRKGVELTNAAPLAMSGGVAGPEESQGDVVSDLRGPVQEQLSGGLES